MTELSNNVVAVDEQRRTWSLRREWSRAFTIMLLVLLVAATASIVGVRSVVNELQGTAHQLHRESATVSQLQTDLVGHEEVGHKLLSDERVNRSAYVAQQQQLSSLFASAAKVFPTTDGLRASIVAIRQSWQRGLTRYGLWGNEVQALHGNHETENPTYGASSDQTGALLNNLEGPSLDAMNKGLARGATLEGLLIAALSGWFILALGVTVYFRRRMAKDLVRPVAGLHEGVLRLQAGAYDHRIEVSRHDELGELAEAFNGMAGVLQNHHLALTLQATHDSLTGLPNRASLGERLTASFGLGSNRRIRRESLLFIDIDDFKDVNDSLGHEGGDALLLQLASRLKGCVRPYDLVARLGGDEFAIVVAEDDDGTIAVELAERILDVLQAPFTICGTSLDVAVSIGVARKSPDTVDSAELLRDADFAMYMAKGAGKGRYQLFDAHMRENMLDDAGKSDFVPVVAL